MKKGYEGSMLVAKALEKLKIIDSELGNYDEIDQTIVILEQALEVLINNK